MNKFIIRVANYFDLEVFSKFAKGTLISDARLWKNEYILETNMSFDEVRQLPFIMAIKNITNTDKDFIRGRRLTDKESNALLFQDIYFNEEEFNNAIKPYIK